MSKIREENEIWKNPPSIKCDWVEVSNLGRCRTLPHLTSRGVKKAGKILRLHSDTRGRPLLIFCQRGHQFVRQLRCVVAECFLPDWGRKKYVFHKNGNVKDCRASNLKVGSKRERYRLTSISNSGGIVLKKGGEIVGKFFGLPEAGRFLGVSKQAIFEALKSNRESRGFKVERVNSMPA